MAFRTKSEFPAVTLCPHLQVPHPTSPPRLQPRWPCVPQTHRHARASGPLHMLLRPPALMWLSTFSSLQVSAEMSPPRRGPPQPPHREQLTLFPPHFSLSNHSVYSCPSTGHPCNYVVCPLVPYRTGRAGGQSSCLSPPTPVSSESRPGPAIL